MGVDGSCCASPGFVWPFNSVRPTAGSFSLNCLGGGITALGFDDSGSGAGVWPRALAVTTAAAAIVISNADRQVAVILSLFRIHLINKTLLAF